MKIVVCGSMAFAKQMIQVKEQLERHGHHVVVPELIQKFIRYKR